MVIGLLLTPLFHWLAPEMDILLTGLAAGTLAYGIGWLWKRRSA